MRIKCPHCNGKGFSEINSALNLTCGWCMGQGELDLEIVPTEQTTNEDFLRTATTEQLAEFISKIDMPFMDKAPFPCGDLIECSKNCGLYSRCVKDDFPTNKEVWVEWLKQPHREG